MTAKKDLENTWWLFIQYTLLFTIGVSLGQSILETLFNFKVQVVDNSGFPYYLAILLGLAGVLQSQEESLPSYFTLKKAPKLTYLIGALLVIGGIQKFTSLYSDGLTAILKHLGYGLASQESAASGVETSLSMLIYTIILGPLSEEVVFRGLILRGLKKYGSGLALVLSALMFGLYHTNIIQTPFAFLIGLVLGYTALNYGLTWSIVLHILNNLWSQVLNAQVSPRVLQLDSFLGWLGLILIISLGPKIWAWWRQKRPKEGLKASLVNLPALIAYLYCLYTIITTLDSI